MINVALIGVGYWGSKYVNVLSSMEDVNIKWICRKTLRGHDWGVAKFIDDIRYVLSDKEVDCVIIATPAETHFEITKKCIEAGKPCLVEKPFTLNSKEAQELVNLNKNNLLIMPGHIYLHHTGIEKLKELIDFDIKEIFSKKLSLSKYKNAISEIAIHDIYILQYLLGNEFNIKKFMGNLEHSFFNLEFNDTQVYIESCSNYSGKIREMIIFGENKKIIFDEIAKHKILITDLKTQKVNIVEFDESVSPLEKQCRHFFDCVEGKDTPKIIEKDGLESIQNIEKLYLKIIT